MRYRTFTGLIQAAVDRAVDNRTTRIWMMIALVNMVSSRGYITYSSPTSFVQP